MHCRRPRTVGKPDGRSLKTPASRGCSSPAIGWAAKAFWRTRPRRAHARRPNGATRISMYATQKPPEPTLPDVGGTADAAFRAHERYLWALLFRMTGCVA